MQMEVIDLELQQLIEDFLMIQIKIMLKDLIKKLHVLLWLDCA